MQPRPAAQVWTDQGWHYFLHGAPVVAGGTRLDLSRHIASSLELALSAGETREAVTVPTGNLDLQAWHHLLVSWDLRGERQYLWLLLDGKGFQSFFPATEGGRKALGPLQLGALQFGNTPSGDDIPLLPMDGAVDEVRVTTTSVADRLVGEGGQ